MKRAFTLAETLTVILIILIVSAATYPVFFQAKARAKQTVCESNMRQVYLAIEQYSQDYGDEPTTQSDNSWWWHNYTGGVMLRCPVAAGKPRTIDYIVTAGAFSGSLSPTSGLGKEWLDCREKRGSDYPYAFDPNHYSAVDAYQGIGQRVVLVRASGQIVSVPFHPYGPWPCAKDLFPEIQH